MRIGLTGASGFIGSRLLAALKGRGQTVSAFRRKKNPSLNTSCFRNFVENKDVIYHLAGVNRASDDELITGNLLATLYLIRAIRESGSQARIIFASSSQVYAPEGKSPIRESRPTRPATLYGVAKRAAEDAIRVSGLNYSILRIANVYGPGCRPYYNSVVATFCDRAVRGQPLIIDGEGIQGRDFIYLDDVVEAFYKAREGKAGIYNIGSGKIVSLRKLVGEIRREVPSLKVEYLKDRDSGNPSYSCDGSRFMKEYCWKPRTSLRQGVQETLKWARSQKMK
tara:strand:+ start:216 stop:1058 length:843 start_codon:yes stop_codon:yes gene_type:complete